MKKMSVKTILGDIKNIKTINFYNIIKIVSTKNKSHKTCTKIGPFVRINS